MNKLNVPNCPNTCRIGKSEIRNLKRMSENMTCYCTLDCAIEKNKFKNIF